jgi:D-beta-D-heptose 7-phosphate kinase/D-beta-D-heptose 1-phosphate adenosyltransferase
MSKIIFTNGCFDIIHTGHIRLLEYAKSLGDYLIVGLNSDDSIKRLKGETRPINKEKDRKYILECIRFVDQVIIFEEDTPYKLLQKIKPHIIVKGGDYTKEEVVGNDLAEVVIFKYINGYSTTNIIKNIGNR